jgi:hypothetical protein
MNFEYREIPADLRDDAKLYATAMIEAARRGSTTR